MVKAFVQWLLYRGCRPQFDEETNRRILVVNLFAMVGYSITLLLGVSAVSSQKWLLASCLLAASLLFFLSSQIHVIFRNKAGQIISVYLLTGCLMGLETYLVVTGGIKNTGPLWIYILPPVAMFFGGFRRGLMVMVAFTMLIAIILLFPDNALLLTDYDEEFKTRLLYSFMTVTFLSAFYEFSRQRTYERMRALSEEFEHQASHDSLTQLPNRRGMNQLMEQELRRHQRNKQTLSVVLCDVDKFKQINDTYGHDNGDIVLQKVSAHLRQNIRRQDIVSRWGGEEFLIVLPETDETNAAFLAEKIRTSLQQCDILLNDQSVVVTASFGVCEINNNITLDRALSLADKALYQAKHAGRNQVVRAHQP